jgi:hypothetical protein
VEVGAEPGAARDSAERLRVGAPGWALAVPPAKTQAAPREAARRDRAPAAMPEAASREPARAELRGRGAVPVKQALPAMAGVSGSAAHRKQGEPGGPGRGRAARMRTARRRLLVATEPRRPAALVRPTAIVPPMPRAGSAKRARARASSASRRNSAPPGSVPTVISGRTPVCPARITATARDSDPIRPAYRAYAIAPIRSISTATATKSRPRVRRRIRAAHRPMPPPCVRPRYWERRDGLHSSRSALAGRTAAIGTTVPIRARRPTTTRSILGAAVVDGTSTATERKRRAT